MKKAQEAIWLSIAAGDGRVSVALSQDKYAATVAFKSLTPRIKSEKTWAIRVEGKTLSLISWLRPKSRDELLGLIHTVVSKILYG